MRDEHVFISDRKLVKLYKLFRVRAWLFSGGVVSRDDLRLLAYLGETHGEIARLLYWTIGTTFEPYRSDWGTPV